MEMMKNDDPRYSVESEQAVLGSLLIDPDIIRELLSTVREEDFLLSQDQEIFRAARALFRSGRPVDALTIRDRLGGEYHDYMAQLIEITPTSANWREYAEIMREKATLQRAVDMGASLSAAWTLDDCRRIYAHLGQLLSDGRKLEAWTMPELLESFLQSQDPDQPPVEYITFGLEAVDKGLYISLGDVVILAGLASDGKTCLALQMAWNIAEKHKVGFFSLETEREKIRDRLMAYTSQICFSDIKQRSIDEERWDAWARQSAALAKRNFTVLHCPGMTVTDIQSVSQAYGFEAIFIDYVQLITPETNTRTPRHEQVASISRALHTFAQKSKTLVVELAQLHRMDQEKWRAPTMHDLKETSQFEQDADLIFLLYKPGPKSKLDKKSSRMLTIGKNKEGRQGDWPLYFDGEKQTFSVMAGEDGRSVFQSLQAEGRKIKARNRRTPGQVEFKELYGEDKELPF